MTTKRKPVGQLEQEKKRKALFQLSHFGNKCREEMDINDTFLSGFFEEFASAITRPVHFFVANDGRTQESQPQ